MSSIAANPYINFQGKARQALEFYQAALGGELQLMTENPDGPPKEAGPDDHIMHGQLMFENFMIMGSDGLPEYPPTPGDNMAIALSGDNREMLVKAFDLLTADGMVKQALKEESWGDMFGYFTDKFGINWMVNIYVSRN